MFELKDLIGLLDAKVNVTSVLLMVGAALGGVYVVKRVAGVALGLVKGLVAQFPVTALTCVTLVVGGAASFGYGIGESRVGVHPAILNAPKLHDIAVNENTRPDTLKQVLEYAKASEGKPDPVAGNPRLAGLLIALGLGLIVSGGITAVKQYG